MITFSEEGKTELLKAFVAAQGEMDAVYKNANNPAFKTKYANLSAVLEAVMPALSKHGLALIQSASYDDDGVAVETIIAHTGGGMMTTTLRAKPQNATPQGVGSVVTYLRRYSVMAVTAVAPEDDDGNAGTMAAPKAAKQSAPSAAQMFLADIRKRAEACTDNACLDQLYLDQKDFAATVLDAPEPFLAILKARRGELANQAQPEPKNNNPFEGE